MKTTLENNWRDLYCDTFGYVVKNNVCLFYRGILSQWWGSFPNQEGGGFTVSRENFNYFAPNIFTKKHINEKSEYKFNCAEQWMMACKAAFFGDIDTLEKILATTSAKEQQRLGRQVNGYIDEQWGWVKKEVVFRGNLYKFNQNENSRSFLCSFDRNMLFAEASPIDGVWGIKLSADDPKALDVANWNGQNLLGEVIRKVRRSYE
jgi:ribA/ribD-fused uncharacterized protein